MKNVFILIPVLPLLVGCSQDSLTSEEAEEIKRVDDKTKQADDLWLQGKKEDAVELYMDVINNTGKRSVLSRAYGRVINYQVEQHGADAARPLIEDAAREGLEITLLDPTAQQYFQEAREKYLEKEPPTVLVPPHREIGSDDPASRPIRPPRWPPD